jgi:glucokinase
LEDFVSARGIVTLYGNQNQDKQYTSKEIADLALHGDRQAIQAYHDMGTALGQGLAETFAHFAPETIIIGGKIGRSLDLYKESILKALADIGVPEPEILQAAPGNLAIWGAAKHVFATMCT